MTENKPMMIDGIDVSECTHYSGGECLIDYYLLYGYEISYYGYCKDCKDCYFKQLARKTQKCEELSKNSIGFAKKCQKLELEIFHLKDKNNVLTRQQDQLKAVKKLAEQKLEQIRQIVNKLSLSINWNINKNAYEKLQSIIQIIDEVE